MNQGYYLDLKLFLEGIEVPVIGASVTASVGSPASANIDIVPDDSLDMLLPRTVVHLFYLDHVQFKSSGRSSPSPGHYKLLFCGEVFSISSNKAGMGSRAATLSCLDFSNTLDTSFIYELQMTSDPNTSSILKDQSIFLATDNRLFDNIVNSPSEIIRRTSQNSPSTPAHSGKKSLLGGLLSIIEVLNGVQGHYYGVNPWITIQERRVRFIDSIIGDDGNTAANIFEVQQFSDWLTKRLASPGNIISFRQLTSILFDYIFYSMVPVPTARYIPGASIDVPNKPNRDIPKLSDNLGAIIGELTDTDREAYDRFKGVNPQKLSLRKDFHDEVFPFLEELDNWIKNSGVDGRAGTTGGSGSGRKGYVQLTTMYSERADLENAQSAHNFGCAVDFVFYYSDGGPGAPGSMSVSFGSRAVTGDDNISCMSKVGEPVKKTNNAGKTWYHRLRHKIFDYANAYNLTSVSQMAWGGFQAYVLANPDFIVADSATSTATTVDCRDDIKVALDYATFCTKAEEISKKYSLKYRGANGIKMGELVCPLMYLLGIGSDPVHVELLDWTSRKSEIIAASKSLVGLNSEREALNSFVLRPDVWFAPPPKSNVIFPDMIQQFSTSREMLRETSRLQLDVGFSLQENQADNSLTQYYFAPQFRDKTNIAPTLSEQAKNMYIFDHEKFSGVVPKFERMTDAIYFGLKSSEITAQINAQQAGTVNSLAPKVAHFHLLTNRYMARSASASLAFSPHIIPGFPAAVIDSTMTQAEINNSALATASTSDGAKKRSFKLGMVQSVTHSISQGGAQTQVRLSHVRSHRTGSESDDSFSESIGSDGVLTIQDPIATSVQASAQAKVSIGGGIASTMLNTEVGDEAFFWTGIAVACGKSSFFELVRDIAKEPGPQTTVTGIRAINQDEIYTSIPATPYQKVSVIAGSWSGGPTEVLIEIQNFGTVFGISPLIEIPVRSLESDSLAISIDEYRPALGRDFEFDPAMPLIGFIREGTLCIPMVLPGNTFTGSLSQTQGRDILPVEEAIRPTWISEDYSAPNITQKIYDPMFGTSAITDFVRDSRFSVNSVEEAVDLVAAQYATQATNSSSILEWIHSYTGRPIADWPEILGEKGVFYDTAKGYVVKDPSPPTGEALKYNGGFHSNAVCFGTQSGYGSKLEYLDVKDTQAVSKLSPSGEALFDLSGTNGDRLDPRLDRARRVELYMSRIQGTVALSGASGIGKRG